ncbi:hypothetical protein HGRIS_006737 [Hohenbuehelia grisea]|uniref:Ras GEF n=1 Tax=Hohenbuehelia grisea TaxID=104357 RepID=A0ABR3J9V7_9AGAR
MTSQQHVESPPLDVSPTSSPPTCASDSSDVDTASSPPPTRTPGHVSSNSTHSSASNESHFNLPIPPATVNNPQASYTIQDVVHGSEGQDPLPPEIAAADIHISPDLSFVETSSGPAARELKRRYDQHIGVGLNVRSPYAITAFINQHGRQMFRVGRRELEPPGQAAAKEEQRISESAAESMQTQSRRQRGSRISVHALLPPAMFKQSSRPQTTGPAPRKLRKTRSIPDLYGGNGFAGPSSNGVPQPTGGSGRAHSQSVTAVDMPRNLVVDAPPRHGDIFGEIMDWPLNSSSDSSSLGRFSHGDSPSPLDGHRLPAVIPYPFGPEVSFDSPSRKPPSYLPTPRFLREMHSFESVMTAKQMDGRTELAPESSDAPPDLVDPDANRPPSAIRLRPPAMALPEYPQDPEFTPTPETNLYSHYSTSVFDILQTSRGLPLLDKLAAGNEEGPVIKLSLSTDDTAAPRDDPRFVVWGEVADADNDSISVAHSSHADLSVSGRSALSRKQKIPGSPNSSITPGTKKILIAATIERWIAQLTSDLNYDELLNFFMTYRTYVSAVDLCHLLICRFHWALGQSSSPHDEMVRRVVRVRTFVAIRYWLLTFFIVDFTPNRDLRLLVANWLNTLVQDPILKKHPDGLSIVRKLRKVAKDCRKANTRKNARPKARPSQGSDDREPMKQGHVLGEKFAEATRQLRPTDDDSDVDLDFFEDDEAIPDAPDPAETTDPSGVRLSSADATTTRPTSIPLSSLSILQQTSRAPVPGSEVEPSFVQPVAAPLPIHHSALSRVLVKTIGRLGRWKRVLNNRTQGRTAMAPCNEPAAFDLELTVSRDLLTVNGGVEQYLKMIEPQASSTQDTSGPPAPPSQSQTDTPLLVDDQASGTVVDKDDSETSPSLAEVEPTPAIADTGATPHHDVEVGSDRPSMPPAIVTTEPSSDATVADVRRQSQEDQPVEQAMNGFTSTVTPDDIADATSSERAISFRSSSTDSFGAPLPPGATAFSAAGRSPWQFDIVSIDDLDLSDSSSDECEEPVPPPGLRKPPRRLPLRRDFEFIRPVSVSSISALSRDSIVSATSSSRQSSIALGADIHQWQVNALVDSLSVDEEGGGNVDDALRRLEGQINPQKIQEKANKVDGWVRSIRERMAAGDYGDDEPRFSDDEDDYGVSSYTDGTLDENLEKEDSDVGESISISPPSPTGERPQEDDDHMASEFVSTPIAMTHTIPQLPSSINVSTSFPDGKPTPEAAVPIEILESRMPHPPVKAVHSDLPRYHRPFFMTIRSETLAQHFAMIDRELYLGLRFEELVLNDWMSCEEVNVLDWSQYLKDRVRWKIAKVHPDKTSALAAIRGRFNLVANFVVSEIVLAPPVNRAAVCGKLVRIAMKSYELSNFHTLVAIIAGLRNEWVQRALRRIPNRMNPQDVRMLNDLKEFTTPLDDFKYIRTAIDSIADNKPLESSSHAPSIISSSGANRSRTGSESRQMLPTACVPFIGKRRFHRPIRPCFDVPY